jgi:hypothetical protein
VVAAVRRYDASARISASGSAFAKAGMPRDGRPSRITAAMASSLASVTKADRRKDSPGLAV